MHGDTRHLLHICWRKIPLERIVGQIWRPFDKEDVVRVVWGGTVETWLALPEKQGLRLAARWSL